MIRQAERPVLYVGAGVHLSDASSELTAFAEATGIPVVSTSWGGRGLLPDAHPLYVGASGNFGWRSANEILQAADLWVAVGTSFSQMSTGSWSLTKPDAVVHVDVDQYELAKIFEPTIAIQADAKNVLGQLAEIATEADVGGAATVHDTLSAWRTRTAESKASWLELMASLYDGTEVPINQYFLISQLSRYLPEDALVVGDSGNNAFGLYRSFEYKTVTPLATGGRYMSLGAGLPVAIGAKLAAPERTVVSYHGDGGFYYDMMELSTLVEHGLKVIVIIDNNHCLVANRSSARATGMDNPWVDLPQTTDFVTVAKGLGVDGERVERPEDIPAALERAVAHPSSYLLDVHTEPALRLVRAIPDIIPIVGDRTPKQGHLATVIEGSWPS